MPEFGLKKDDLEQIVKVISKFPEIQTALIFGSRAKGISAKGSDVDLAVKGSLITDNVISSLKDVLENQTLLPYFFDVVHFENIKNDNLVEHINRVAQTIYNKNT